MKLDKIKFFGIAGFLLFLAQSCSESDDLVLDNDNLTLTTNELSSMSNEIILEWTDLAVNLERYAAGRPNTTARAMAYIYLSIYETIVPGMEGYESLENEYRNLRIRNSEQPDTIIWEAAINAAFAVSLEHFLYQLPEELEASITSFEESKTRELALRHDEELLAASAAWGAYVAGRLINFSETDDDAEEQIADPQPTSYEPPTGEGFWTYSAEEERALFPYWGESVRTFVIDPEETSTVDPLSYSQQEGSAYYEQMMEVYETNNEAKESNEELLWIAEFWSDDVEDLMMSPPMRQISIANQLIEQYDLSVEESAVMLLKVGFALNDAAAAAWKHKYDHMVMRPNVFIQDIIDDDYQTNLYRLVFWPNPTFPSYPSGHSTFASAAAGVFIDHFVNATDFTDRSHEGRTEFLGDPRTFTSFEELATENAYSRIPLGVHMRMDCDEGLRLGYEIADAINAFRLD